MQTPENAAEAPAEASDGSGQLTPTTRALLAGRSIAETSEIQAECYRGEDYLCPIHGSRHHEETR
jgi:hypothetical protein